MFTIIESICGAALIQFATTSYLEQIGQTVGLSSIAYNAVFQPNQLNLSMVAGLLSSAALVAVLLPQYIPPLLVQSAAPSIWYVLIAGLLVGLGTSWGSGCTSGHMLCGLSLLRWRSLVATAVFSGVAMFVVNFFDLAPGCGDVACSTVALPSWGHAAFLLVFTGVMYGIAQLRVNKLFSGFATGLIFGSGLFISGMANPAKPQGFLAMFNSQKFDPSLLMIMLFAVLPNALTWRKLVTRQSHPTWSASYNLPTARGTPPKFLAGAALFGIGWGMQGICPGPGIITAPLSLNSSYWLAAFLVGSRVAKLF